MDGVTSIGRLMQGDLASILFFALILAVAACAALGYLLWRAQKQITMMRARRGVTQSLPGRLNQRVAKSEKMPIAAPINGASLIKSMHTMNNYPGDGPLLAKKPRARRDPILPSDIASDYQAKAKANEA